jgi:hypothetical protein
MTKVIAPWETRLHVHQSWAYPCKRKNIMHGMHHCFTFKAWTRMSIYCYNMRFIKHIKKFPNVFGRHLYVSMNIPPTKEEGSYAYSLRVRGRLRLIIGVRSFTLLSRHKNHPLLMPCDLSTYV